MGIFQIREWIVVPGTIRYTQDCGPHFGLHDTRTHYALETIIFLVLEGRELERKGRSKGERGRESELFTTIFPSRRGIHLFTCYMTGPNFCKARVDNSMRSINYFAAS